MKKRKGKPGEVLGSNGKPLPDVKPEAVCDVDVKINGRLRYSFRVKIWRGMLKRELAFEIASRIYEKLEPMAKPIVYEPEP